MSTEMLEPVMEGKEIMVSQQIGISPKDELVKQISGMTEKRIGAGKCRFYIYFAGTDEVLDTIRNILPEISEGLNISYVVYIHARKWTSMQDMVSAFISGKRYGIHVEVDYSTDYSG